MIGFARVITDYVTFGYLTDVYVEKEHQGRGLARWMMHCLNETVSQWPELRGLFILTGSPDASRLYESTLGARDLMEQAALTLLNLSGVGSLGASQTFRCNLTGLNARYDEYQVALSMGRI